MKPSDAALRAPVIIGPGRVGRSLAAAAGRSGASVELRGRDEGLEGLGGKVVLLCVPDAGIRDLADRIGAAGDPPGLIGHTSGATGLEALSGAGAAGAFSVHPLQTVPDGEADLSGCPAAIAGNTPDALDAAAGVATMSGMRSFEVSEAGPRRLPRGSQHRFEFSGHDRTDGRGTARRHRGRQAPRGTRTAGPP